MIKSFADEVLAIKDFESELSVQKSKNTALSYTSDVLLFHKFLIAKQRNFTECSRDDIYEYFQDYLVKDVNFLKPLEITSLRRKISSLSVFFDFLIKYGFRKDNPLSYFEKPKIRERVPIFLEKDEIITLLDDARKNNTKNGIRDCTILELLYSCGMRITECLTLEYSNTVSSNGIILENIIIKGKGEKERVVFLNKHARSAIVKYLPIRNFLGDAKSKFLFCSNKSKSGHLSRESFFLSLRKMVRKNNIQDISPHKIRHSFATHMYRSGIDIKFLQALLGHSDITTTEYYTHVGSDDLFNTVLKFHPASKKSKI